MAPHDLREVILPGVEVFPVVPRREAPNRRKATAIDPHGWITSRIRIREECWNHGIERLGCLSRLTDNDGIRGVRELEIVDGAGANGLAQPADNNAARLPPRLLYLRSSGIGPPAGTPRSGRSKRPR